MCWWQGPPQCCCLSPPALLLLVAVLGLGNAVSPVAGRLPSVKLDSAIENSCCLLPLLGLFWGFLVWGFFRGGGGNFPLFCSNEEKKDFFHEICT